jgi:PhnB protein
MTLGSETAIPLREGYRSVTPSIFVNGAEQFIDFLKAVFGAEERLRVPGTEGTRIRYVEMKIGNSMIELGDASERYPACPAPLHVYVPETEGVYRRTLDAGATSLHAVEGMPYGERSGSVKDPFGNHWYTHIPETRRRSTRTCARRAPTGYSRHLAPKSSKCIANRRAARSGTRRSGLGDTMVEMGEAHGQYRLMPTGLHYYVPDGRRLSASAQRRCQIDQRSCRAAPRRAWRRDSGPGQLLVPGDTATRRSELINRLN